MTEVNHRCAVLGKPIAHSLSPVLHNAAYHALHLDDWSYDKHEVGEPDLEGFLESLDPTWSGLSLMKGMFELPLTQVLVQSNTAVLATISSLAHVLHGRTRHRTRFRTLVSDTCDNAEDGPFGNGRDHRQRQHRNVGVSGMHGDVCDRTCHRCGSPS